MYGYSPPNLASIVTDNGTAVGVYDSLGNGYFLAVVPWGTSCRSFTSGVPALTAIGATNTDAMRFQCFDGDTWRTVHVGPSAEVIAEGGIGAYGKSPPTVPPQVSQAEIDAISTVAGAKALIQFIVSALDSEGFVLIT